MANQLYGAPAIGGVCTGEALYGVHSQAGYDATDDSVKWRWGPIPATDSTGAPIAAGATQNPATGQWTNGAPQVSYDIGPIVFMLRLGSRSRVQIKLYAATTPPTAESLALADFMSILADSRTLDIVLNDPDVVQAVELMTTLNGTDGLPLIDPAAVAAILAPVPA